MELSHRARVALATRYAGVPAAEAAAAAGVTEDDLRTARTELGRCPEDGQPGRHSPPAEDAHNRGPAGTNFDALMRANRCRSL